MELGHQEEAHALRRAGQPGALARRSPRTCSVPLGDGHAVDVRQRRDLLPLRREHPRRRRVRAPEHCEPINDRIIEQLIMIDAAKRASAKRITAVSPFYGYARQDRKAEGREPITARLARRHAHRRRRRPRRHRRPAHRPDPGLLRLPRRPPHRGAAARRLPGARRSTAKRSRSSRPTPAAASSPAGSRTASARPASTPSSRSSTSAGRRARTTSPSPPRSSATVDGRTLRAHRRHDRHRRHARRARPSCSSTRGAESVIIAATHGLLSGPAVDRLKNAPVREVVVTNTLPDPRRQALRQPHGALDRPDRRRGPRRRLRGHQRQRDLPRRQPVDSRAVPSALAHAFPGALDAPR